MGLWDILVPAEPGVLHNTIANPSFEYDSGEISKIFGKYSPTRQNLKYWSTTHGSVAISASTDWASQGKTSLKIAKAVTAGASAGIQYYPRASSFSAPTLVTSNAAGAGGTISGVLYPTITIGVMPLTDVGMSLANGITDTQLHPDVSASLPLHAYLHPSIDSRRGHGASTYATLSLPSSTGLQARVTILDTSTSRNNFPSGWAVWYSTSAPLTGGVPTNGTFQLAGVFANPTSFMDGTISFTASSTQFTGTNTNFTQTDVGKVLYTTTGTVIGTIAAISTPTNGTFNPSFSPTFNGVNIEFRTTITIGINNIIVPSAPTQVGTELLTIDPTSNITVNRSSLDFTSADIGKHIYVKSPNNMFVFVGTIQNAAAQQWATLTAPAQYTPFNQLFWLSTESNPQSFPNNTQGSLRMYTVATSVFSPPEIQLDATAPYWGITNSSYGNFTKKHHLYLDWYLSADNPLNPNATYNNTGADWSVYLYNNITSTATLLGKLDSTGTTASAKRMGLRTKFLIDRPSDNTSNMSIRILYTGTGASDAALYIDGVQFVDVGMIWRAYDWYGANIGTSTTPPQFSDWDWDTVEFSYVDGDTPGAMWSDTMPTQSGTYTSSFPFFTNLGIWLRDFYEFETVSSNTNAGGYAGPRSRLNYQWRNSSSPVYGISVPGLSQSSMQTQTFTTGFYAPLDTSNINVIVEPQVSGVGMPEIATTSIEYGIVDGGYVQRQVARMRNFQLTVTISAQSWTGLHANRRSLINLLKFDQLSQQGERRIRYRGAGVPVYTSVTYQSGLEYSGTQGTSFTEGLALRFLSTDPYFYTETSVSTDASPEKYDLADFSHVLYKLGGDAEWMPLSHKYYTYDNNNDTIIGGKTYFFDNSNVNRAPRGIGWIQSPSGTVSALIVAGDFLKPVPYLAAFYVSGYNGGLADNFAKVTVEPINTASKLLVSAVGSTTFSIAGTYELTSQAVGKYLFNKDGRFIGQIATVNPNNSGSTTGTFVSPAAAANNPSAAWSLVVLSTSATETMPNNVHLHNLLSANDAIYYVYQESANSVLVTGVVSTMTDSLTGEPTSTGTTGYVASKVNETFPTYRNRVFRIMMNDNGKITVQAVDDVFTKTFTPLGAPTSVTYTSSLYSLLFYNNTVNSIFSVSRTPSNYMVLASKGNNTSGVIAYDLGGGIDRSSSAFANETVASSVLGIDPVGNAITIGMRTTVRGAGFITASVTDPNKCLVTGSDGAKFTGDWVGRALYTLDGLFIGKVYAVLSDSSLLLSEPSTIYMLNQQYEISVDTFRVVSDNKSIRSSLYASARWTDAKLFNTAINKSLMYGYFNNPSLLGSISVVSGSRALGSTANIADAYGIAYSLNPTATITFNNTVVAASVVNTQLNQSHVGSYVLATSNNEYIGRVAEVLTTTTFNFTSVPKTSAFGSGIPFYFRSSRQLVDATGYTSLAGNMSNWINDNVVVLEFNARTSFTNAIVPDFIVPSINSTGTAETFKTPYIFSDTSSTNAFIMTQSNSVNQILRRGVFDETYNRNLYSRSIDYLTDGWGIIIGGNDTPRLTARAGTIATSTANRNFTVASTTVTSFDVGRSVYTATGVFLGIIGTVATSTTGTFLNNGGATGTFSAPLTTGQWYPYQFGLQTTLGNTFYSSVNQGMALGNTAVAKGFTTSFTVSFCNVNVVGAIPNPCLYAYMNGMWYFVGIITLTTATTITIGGGTNVAMPSGALLTIAPAMVVWSSSARRYEAGHELYCLLGPSPSSDFVQTYMGTVSAVITQTDNYAILAVLPYTYLQGSANPTPGSNQWSVTSAATMVWIGAKQYRGSQKSNFFADVYGTGLAQTGDFTGVAFNRASAVTRDSNANFIMPGVLRGVISTSATTTPNTVTGLNTSFSATASANNPMATNKYLYTFDGRLLGTGFISAVGSTTSLTLSAASNRTATHMYYRIGTSNALADGGVLSSSNSSQIVNFSTVAFTVNISSAVGSTITLTAATFIKDNWIGRAIYLSNTYNATTYVGIVSAITTTVITFEAPLNVTPNTGVQTIYVASVPLKWTFRGGDVIRTTTAASATTHGLVGTILGQVRDVLVPTNSVILTASAAFTLADKPFVVQRGVGISKGSGVLTQITSSSITGIGTFFSTLPIDSNLGACADIYIAASTGASTSIASAANFTLVGQAYITTSDTVMQIRDSQLSFASTVEYEWYYVLRNYPNQPNSTPVTDTMQVTDFYTNTLNTYITGTMLGLGTITASGSGTISIPGGSTTGVWIVTGANSIVASPGAAKTPTQFTYQVAPGDVIGVFNSGGTYLNMPFRVVQVLSDYELVVTSINGNAYASTTSLPWSYTIVKATDEMVAFDQGVTGYTNTDWQRLGYTNNPIYTLHTTFNGDVYAGGEFTQWVKQSSANPDAASGDAISVVNRMAKIVVGLNSYGYVLDAYGAPIAGNSYTRNGFFDGEVLAITDTSNINPVNGYVGSSDTILVGGSFTKTTDNVAVSSGLAVLPSSSISNTMRQVVNSDVSVVNSALTTASTSAQYIAVSNRLRNYNGLIATNVLDGINGSNIAVSYNQTVTINHTTTYKAVRVRGNASAYPIISIEYSTDSNLSVNASKSLYQLIQTVTGAKIEFVNNQLLVYNGEKVIIDLRLGRRTVTSNLRGNLANALNPSSNFVDFILLGANNSAGLSTQSYDDYRVNVIGVHGDYGLTVTITYVPRFWSFDTNNLFYGTTKAGL